jgi:DNA-binding NtrC family response regulator
MAREIAMTARPNLRDEDARPQRLRVFGETCPPVDDDVARRVAPTLITQSPAMLAVLKQARRVAATKASVLIEGESGTGKELIARLIHSASPRQGRPFIRVNCAALSESLVESELFGHEKGAFTGADQERPGRFERAHGGSLLLDEIGEMPLKLQAKLLRVLEEEEFERVGGVRTLSVNVRAIATTNRDLPSESLRGQFRHDLFYRLSAVRLEVPPLRTRPEDVAPLVQHFIERFGMEGDVSVRSIGAKALDRLTAHPWPGNIRQLRNVVQHACILAEGDEIQVGDLPNLAAPLTAATSMAGRTLDEVERRLIEEALRDTGGNKTAAAKRLGVTPRTLFNKLKKYCQSAV